MATRNTEILVGITVVAAVAVVLWSVTYLKDVRLARHSHQWIARFPDVGGLREADPVSVNGVKKGQVKAIHLGKGEVYVDLVVERDLVFTSASRVYVRNVGLMGEKFIAVDLGPGGLALAAGRDTLTGIYERGVPEVISQMGSALQSLQRISDEVDRTLALAEERGTVRKTLRNLEDASAELRATLDDTKDDLRAIAENARAASESGRRIAEASEPRVKRTFDTVERTSGDLDSLIARLDSLTTTMQEITHKVNAGETTAGKIVNERELYDDMRHSVREFSALVKDLRENPRKYLKFSLF